MQSKWKWWLLRLILVLALGALIINRIQGQPEFDTANAGVQAVKTAVAEKSQRQNILQITGTVDAAEKDLITARVAGIVESLNVDNGELVGAGQTLLQIDDQAYQSLVTINEATLTQAQTKLNSTRTTFDRMKQLHEAGAVSDQDFENTQAALTAAEADVSAARAALGNAQNDLSYTRVVSPISGLVVNRNVIRGQMVAQGTPLMEVHNLAEVNVIVSIGQSELGNIKLGQPAEITVDAFNDQVFKGTLTSVNQAASPQARVFLAKIKTSNPDGLLRAGMFASVKIYTGEELTVLSVPEEALTSKQGKFYVFVPQGDVVKMAAVEIGQIYDGRVEIKQGLAEGQVVISSNVNKLKEGDRIQIVTEQGV
ncbi:MAG: efflux RND transporter periplasmic adaptor subunit [Syntrophomonadaceae bacterium]|nr:efflux RND transporter periplasmic adaptor subunit [Syntrophomonadaceae bacterium]